MWIGECLERGRRAVILTMDGAAGTRFESGSAIWNPSEGVENEIVER